MSDLTALIWSDRFQLHDTGSHPENARRLAAIWARLEESGLLKDRPVWEPRPASTYDVALVHNPEYVRMVERFARSGGGYLDHDTYVSAESYEVALLAAGAAKGAVDAVLNGDARRVFAFPRPPGHHAERGRAMGFCVFNSIAVAAQHALDRRGLGRIAIIDWDVHHGNGTQAMFYDEDRVFFISIHQSPLYPGTGRPDQTGGGPGLGLNLNITLSPGSGDGEYIRVFDDIVAPRIRDFQPELIMVSAGFDAHRDDPLAMMDVTERGFAHMARRTRELADHYAGGRLVLILEGGYNLQALASSVEATIRALDEEASEEGSE